MLHTVDALAATLEVALGRPLPGAAAHALMAVRPRFGWRPGEIPDGLRAAAALVLLLPRDGSVHVVLTLRPEGMARHAGQISFPGGEVEPGESVEAAALREAAEEVGIAPSGARVLGRLTPLHIPVSGYVLHPVVAAFPSPPRLTAAEGEVAAILEVPLERLADRERVGRETRILRGGTYEVPFFDVAGGKVWGATAMVLAELLAVLGCAPDPWGAS